MNFKIINCLRLGINDLYKRILSLYEKEQRRFLNTFLHLSTLFKTILIAMFSSTRHYKVLHGKGIETSIQIVCMLNCASKLHVRQL